MRYSIHIEFVRELEGDFLKNVFNALKKNHEARKIWKELCELLPVANDLSDFVKGVCLYLDSLMWRNPLDETRQIARIRQKKIDGFKSCMRIF